MKVVITVDVELWSWRRDFELDIEKPVFELVKLADREKIPIILFISLSDKGYGDKNYRENVTKLLRKIKSKYISYGIHTHCKNLPLNFETKSDNLKDYSLEKEIEILKWYKKNVERITEKKIVAHRAGNWAIPSLKILDEAFKKAGIKIDSSDLSQEYSKIIKTNSLVEIPPATNRRLSRHPIVWSPDQMTVDEMINFYNEARSKTDVLVMNFHSFSISGNLGSKVRVWNKIPAPFKKVLRLFLIKKGRKSISDESFRKLKRIVSFIRGKAEFYSLEKLT